MKFTQMILYIYIHNMISSMYVFAILDYMCWIFYIYSVVYCCLIILMLDCTNICVSPIHPKSTCGGFLRRDPSVIMVVSRLEKN